MKKIATHYDVGFGKPPKETQFIKGRSGNPAGRPKGSKNKPKLITDERFKDMVLEEAYREIAINDDTGTMTIPIVQAGLRSMTVKAAKGDYRSLKLMTELIDRTETEKLRRKEFEIGEAMEYLVKADEEVRRRELRGQSVSDIIPHPNDIFIDTDKGTVKVIGPMTYTDQKRMIQLFETRQMLEVFYNETEDRLMRMKNPQKRLKIEKEQQELKKTIRRIDNHLQGWRPKE